ncbi:cytochrome P450 [Mycena rebaudengoi]|nr:cytochrome P450 [Mycena rebaudengoi]
MPSSKEWETFHEWGLRFGPIVMVKVMGQRMCIINSYAIADELLNGRSGIYSDRPALTMVNDLYKFNMGLQQYGPVYKKHRKVFQSGFSSERSTGYQAVQNREITLLLQKLLEHPTEIDHYLKSAIGAIIMMIGLGYPTTDHDQFIRIAEAAQLAMVSAARPGAYLVDLIPVLKYVPEWFPGAAFKRIAREGRELSHELQTKPFAWAMKQFIDGKALPSFFNDLMEHPEVASEDPVEAEHIIRCTTALMYATGVDTIFSSALTFILAMLHTPEVQKKAQEELDRVVGPDRLPTFTDKKSLPYISAILKESLRWESVIPLGVPHRVMKDDTYQGYSIPAGTIIIANQWGMSHDETVFSDAFIFRPERFLNTVTPALDPSKIAFGWGRRICPGRFLAEDLLWLTISTMLACFNITPTSEPDGSIIIPPREYTTGLGSHFASRPLPFSCKITSRSPAASDLIRQSAESLPEFYY